MNEFTSSRYPLIAKDQGYEVSAAFFYCCGRSKTKEEFIKTGIDVANKVFKEEEDKKFFIIGWIEAWRDSFLLLELLSNEDQVLIQCTRLIDRRKLVIKRQLFGRACLCDGGPSPDSNEYATTYDYESPQAALIALEAWNPCEAPEPAGWIHHHDTGRYRIDGDRSLERVKDNNSIPLEYNIAYAVRATQGINRIICSIQERSEHIGREMPEGTQCFIVKSRDIHTKQEHYDLVYHYNDWSVVISFNDLSKISLANVIHRLTGGNRHT